MIKFPYGISDFHLMRKERYLYLDRTASIPELENSGRQLLFLRPRRFGKSLLLSTLVNYYDLLTANDFPMLFGDLAIGQNPTSEHNQYLILRWDFSKVSAQGDTHQIRQNLFDHLNATIKECAAKYRDFLKGEVTISTTNAFASLESLTSVVQNSGYSLYLFIDEYDNFANEILMHDGRDHQRYLELLAGEGIVKTLFKVIKASASEGKISRVFITGVSPVALSDMTSGYNVATNIYLEPRFNALCGVTQDELRGLLDQLIPVAIHDLDQAHSLLDMMRRFYNGYRFCENLNLPLVYNPTLSFYFLRYYQEHGDMPRQMLDGNLAMDAGRLRYIAQLPAGRNVIVTMLDDTQPSTLIQLETSFGVAQLQRVQQDPRYMVSLLYFFGVLTIANVDSMGRLVLAIPNLVIRGLYLEQLREQILPQLNDQITAQQLAEQFFQSADLAPLVHFIETKYFKVLDNRDYRWSNELTIKTTFLSLLFNDLFYIMDSEAVIERRYSDLTMIIRPNMRRYPQLKDFVFEFKYLSLAEVRLSAEQIRSLSREDLALLPIVQQVMQEALSQLQTYRQALDAKYQEPQRLCTFAVVALGFERVLWQRA